MESVHKVLKDILTRLGFDVEAKADISSLTRAAVIGDMKTLSQDQRADCVLVAMTVKGGRKTMSYKGHQLAKDVIHARDKDLPMEDILKEFAGSQTLAGKPKIFLVQFYQEVSLCKSLCD